MSDLPQAAPLWRRLIAAVYDGLLLIGLWATTVLIDSVLRAIAGRPHNWGTLQICVFVVWLGFFGWSWTRGGQTLGMRVWRLRVERDDGQRLTWLSAAIRYAAMLVVWGVVLTPAMARLPHLRDEPHAVPASLICVVLAVLGLIVMFLDSRRRAPHDWISGTSVTELPKPAKQTAA